MFYTIPPPKKKKKTVHWVVLQSKHALKEHACSKKRNKIEIHVSVGILESL